MAGQDGDEIVLLIALFQQRRKRGLELSELGLLGSDVRAADIAFGLLVLQQAEDLAVDPDQLVGRRDLVFQLGLGDRRESHVRA